MDFKEMSVEELMERRAAIPAELDAPEADLDALEAEVRAINDELEARKNAESQRNAIRAAVAAGKGEVIETKEIIEERKTEDMGIEMRNTPEYILAYAKYLQSGNDAECRALLTENASGTVAVPEFVYDVVKTAWDGEGIMRLVKKSYLKGNIEVPIEVSASGATNQTEGVQVSEQTLVLGTVDLKPAMIKKWVSISNQALRIDQAQAYLTYIYRELAHNIAKKAADNLIAKIEACGTVSTSTCVGVPKVTAASIGMGTIAAAISNLSDEATSPVIMMNKQTWAKFKAVQYANGYGADPFEGLPVEFNNTISSFDAATTGVTYAIVGDLANGALANFPDGEGISVLRDPYTLADYNLTRFVGDEYVGLGIIGPGHFVKVTK